MGMSDKPNRTSNLIRTSWVSSYDSSIGLQLRKDKDKDKDTEGGEKSKDSKKASKDKKKDPKEDEDLKSWSRTRVVGTASAVFEPPGLQDAVGKTGSRAQKSWFGKWGSSLSFDQDRSSQAPSPSLAPLNNKELRGHSRPKTNQRGGIRCHHVHSYSRQREMFKSASRWVFVRSISGFIRCTCGIFLRHGHGCTVITWSRMIFIQCAFWKCQDGLLLLCHFITFPSAEASRCLHDHPAGSQSAIAWMHTGRRAAVGIILVPHGRVIRSW